MNNNDNDILMKQIEEQQKLNMFNLSSIDSNK